MAARPGCYWAQRSALLALSDVILKLSQQSVPVLAKLESKVAVPLGQPLCVFIRWLSGVCLKLRRHRPKNSDVIRQVRGSTKSGSPVARNEELPLSWQFLVL